MSALSFDDRILGLYLGLGDLGDARERCHGYQSCCACTDCLEREAGPVPAPMPAKQPWELAA